MCWTCLGGWGCDEGPIPLQQFQMLQVTWRLAILYVRTVSVVPVRALPEANCLFDLLFWMGTECGTFLISRSGDFCNMLFAWRTESIVSTTVISKPGEQNYTTWRLCWIIAEGLMGRNDYVILLPSSV